MDFTFLFLLRFAYLFELVLDKPYIHWVSFQTAAVSRTGLGCSYECHLGMDLGPYHWTMVHWFPKYICSEMDQKGSGWVWDRCYYWVCQCCKQWFNLLCNNTDPMLSYMFKLNEQKAIDPLGNECVWAEGIKQNSVADVNFDLSFEVCQ